MISSVKIKNFRGFRDININELKAINIIVGDNGSGKTSLLEAIFLAGGTSPQLVMAMKGVRGLTVNTGTGSQAEIYESLWDDLFSFFDKKNEISITFKHTNNKERSFSAYYGDKITVPLTSPKMGEKIPAINKITFLWERTGEEPIKITPELTQYGLQIPSPGEPDIPVSFTGVGMLNSPLIANNYSEHISKKGKADMFFKAMKAQFKEIEAISPESLGGGVFVLHVKLPWLPKMIPFSLMSQGADKLAAILCSIASTSRGIAFIDEIENGFHYTKHEGVWSTILAFAKEFNTQIFLSTHSWEFLKAATPLIDKHENDFSLIRLSQENGLNKAHIVPGKNAAAAIENDMEVRR